MLACTQEAIKGIDCKCMADGSQSVKLVMQRCGVKVLCCCRDEDTDKIGFRGWARMAVPIDEFTIIEVRKPNVGENKPADVTADVVIDTSSKPHAF